MLRPVTAKTLAFLCAMPSELAPVAKELGLSRTAKDEPYRGRVGDTDVLAAQIGIGPESARKATDALLASTPVDHVVVVGIAGALETSVPIGTMVHPELVVLGSTGEEHAPTPLPGTTPSGTLWTADVLLLDEDDLAPLRARGVVALDMETAAVGASCEGRCPWSVIRSISDRATEGLVTADMLGMTNPDGSANVGAGLRHVARRPWALPGLLRLARDGRTASVAAARAAKAAATALS
jgi:adenosylhomocysteine nucleosidase